MAKATAHCICRKCGKEFTVEKTCYNRTMANEFESYASNHYDECPDCYRARMAEERAKEAKKREEQIAKYELPELKGSEKQVAWAKSLRMKTILDDSRYESVDEAVKTAREIAAFDFESECAKLGIDPQKEKNAVINNCVGRSYYIAVTSTSASEIIDACR